MPRESAGDEETGDRRDRRDHRDRITGPVDFLDEEARYERSVLSADLGARWLIETAYFKPYGCCRWAHAAIDAMLQVMAEQRLAPGDIQAVHVETFTQALSLNNDLAPPTLEAAQYSVPFCLAAAAIHGAEALLPLEEPLLRDAGVLAFAPRVTLSVAPDLDPMFPRSVPARIAVTAGRGVHSQTVLAPRGEPVNPLGEDDLLAKFSTIARRRLAPAHRAALLQAIDALAAGDIAPLLAGLGRAPVLARVPANV